MHDRECNKAFRIIFPNNYLSGYCYDYIINELFKILQIAMRDKDKWIEYFVYELDFGREWVKNSVEIYGKDFRLQKAEDLWNLLNGA